MKKLNIYFLTLFTLLSSCAYATSAFYPLEGIKILLDPGHGGVDSGAVGYYGLKEADVNLRVARYLKMLLEADGADVSLTREGNQTVSLTDRVKKAQSINPDLFVSIHHNSSLARTKETKAEIYYAARDNGFSRILGEAMLNELKNIDFGKEYYNIPGGFQVLRSTNIPAILTEGAYLSVPKIELKLMSGKMLTEQAQAYRVAIRKAAKKFINVDYMCPDTLEVNSSYVNILFTPDRPIKKITARLLPQNNYHGFNIQKLTPWGNTFALYCIEPLNSGKYIVEILCEGVDGSLSAKKRIKLNVSLPTDDYVVIPSAPYIPEGFKGRFPFTVYLIDAEGRPNLVERDISFERVIPLNNLSYNLENNIASLLEAKDPNLEVKKGEMRRTNKTGAVAFGYELSGNEKNSVFVKLPYENKNGFKLFQIPILPVENKHYVLGKVEDSQGDKTGINCVEFLYDNKKTYSDVGGYFFIETEKDSLDLKIKATGYNDTEYKIDKLDIPIVLPRISLVSPNPGLKNLGFGIIARPIYREQSDVFANKLTKAGAKTIKLHLNLKAKVPEYAPVIRANEIDDIKVLISFKPTTGKEIEFRHYHSSKNGKHFCNVAAERINSAKCGVKAKVMAASEYELNHSQATAMVVGIPEKIAGNKLGEIFEMIYQALATKF